MSSQSSSDEVTARPRAHRPLFVLAGAALAVLLAIVLLLCFRSVDPAAAQEENKADVVVQFDDNPRAIRTIQFADPISGLAALQLTGLDVVAIDTDFGPAVCSIEQVGCPAENCFCDTNRFWAYSSWDGASWQPYATGAGTSVITQSSAIEGWRWGEFGASQRDATESIAASDALHWLAARQVITDGGYGGASASVETMLAIGSNLLDAGAWRTSPAHPSLEDALAVTGAAYSRSSAGASGKLATAVVASDACLPADALAPAAWYSPTLGAYSSRGAGDNAWALLGALALGEQAPGPVVAYLRSLAQPDGGWEWAPGWGSDTNSTAIVIQALVAAGEPISSTAVGAGVAWLKTTQNQDGGFPYSPGAQAVSDANSTAFVVQALVAAGEQPDDRAWDKGGKTPVGFLLARQLGDGSIEWQAGGGASPLATQQAIPALLGRSYPIPGNPLESCPVAWLPLVKVGE